jgi:hypothetical protein
MANKKFSEFVLKTTTSNVSHIVGYDGTENVRITPANFLDTTGGPYLPLAGGTMTGTNGVVFPDNFYLNLGTSSDFEIYHDSNNSYLKDQGTGELILASNGTGIKLEKTSGEKMIHALTDGAVELYYDSVKKFETTTSGVLITGGLVDSIGNLGNAGQFLSSTGTAFRWLDVVGPTGMGAVTNNTGGNAVFGNIAVWNSATGMNYMPGTYSLSNDSLVIGSTNSGLAADCTGFGIDALRVATGGDNTAVGHRALYQVTGNDNTAMGEYAAISVTSGQDNVVIGSSAAGSLNVGSDNTLIGHQVSGSIGEGMGNTAVGANSLGTLTGDEMLTRGQNNTCIGRFSGNLVDEGNNNTMIGYQSGSSVSDVNNEITLGNSSISSLRCQVTSITALSDQRDKKDIVDLSYGLDFVSSLKPREFIWDHRAEKVMDTMIPAEYDEDGKTIKKAVVKYKEEFSLRKGTKDIGFIAQELQTVDNEWINLVNSNNPEKLEATYGHLIPVLVKAIQELKTQLDNIK